MILHTGLRTDIPAFFSEWFLNRIRAGEVLVRNPYNEKAVTRYKLSPEVIDVLCFCTKNPEKLLSDQAVKLLEPFHQFWFVTITPYGKAYEPNVPDKTQVIESFKKLSGIVGKERVSWRYDPVFIYEKYTVEQHKMSFEKMCCQLEGFTTECIFSFIQLYSKVKKNFPYVQEVSVEQQRELAEFFAATAAAHGIRAKGCCTGLGLNGTGVDLSGCMSKEVLERAAGCRLDFPKGKGLSSRKECACVMGHDIGVYNTCAHFCRYCYANYSKELVLQNMKLHNPESPLLIGNLLPDDVVKDGVQSSWRAKDLYLF